MEEPENQERMARMQRLRQLSPNQILQRSDKDM
nr:MAG TPA: hypothetical protein [Caudoviricetes sp.]